MEVFIGRQPILNRRQETVAYELLFRSGTANQFDGTDGNTATSAVISNTFMTLGAERALGPKCGFLNFTRQPLIEDQAFLLPRDKVVIEILETVEPDAPIVDACRRLKEAGYSLALDDIVAIEQAAPLVPYADYAKVDFLRLNREERRRVGSHFSRHGVRLLAEKVETKPDFESALGDGYELFQGYFFARPEIISAREVPSSKLNCLRLIGELQRPEFDVKHLEDVLRHDVALVRKLLCFVNSAVFSYRQKIDSIAHGLVALGENNIRKWVAMAALPFLASDKPDELVNTSLVRARFCELAAENSRSPFCPAHSFLMGLLSLIDVMIGRPLPELIAEMALDSGISAALLKKSAARPGHGPAPLLDLAVSFEASDPDAVARQANLTGLEVNVASELYVQSIEWVNAVHQWS